MRGKSGALGGIWDESRFMEEFNRNWEAKVAVLGGM